MPLSTDPPDEPDDFPSYCNAEALARLAVDLAVPPDPADTLRARVCAAWADPPTVDRAVPTPTPPTGTPMVLGGMKLGG